MAKANVLQTLDDVDFTVLAATSVLGDLMEKCPPAEACRDAFERMSKATVQMCLSTTGFGSHGTAYQQTQSAPPRPSFASSTSERYNKFPDYSSNAIQSASRQPPAKAKRPPPRFDMNLRDLFPDESSLESFSNSFSGQLRQSQVQVPRQPQHGQVPQHHPTQTQQGQNTNPPFYYDTGTYNPEDLVGIPGMDFLGNDGEDLKVDTNGIDLGLGMGLDFQHDWSDGTQFDLFDGFFFGGGAQ